MSEQIDSWTQKLLALTAESAKVQDLATGRKEAREIGEEINTVGWFRLMREVAHRARDLGREQKQPFALGYIERWWDGIGSWRG